MYPKRVRHFNNVRFVVRFLKREKTERLLNEVALFLLYKENPRIVRGFKKGFADEQKRAEEKAITIRQKRGGKARIEKQAEN